MKHCITCDQWSAYHKQQKRDQAVAKLFQAHQTEGKWLESEIKILLGSTTVVGY